MARKRTNFTKTYKQHGKTTISRDRKLTAKRVGWRKSKSGKWYKETRANRSDRSKKTKL